jgi:hypothetical protein
MMAEKNPDFHAIIIMTACPLLFTPLWGGGSLFTNKSECLAAPAAADICSFLFKIRFYFLFKPKAFKNTVPMLVLQVFTVFARYTLKVALHVNSFVFKSLFNNKVSR